MLCKCGGGNAITINTGDGGGVGGGSENFEEFIEAINGIAGGGGGFAAGYICKPNGDCPLTLFKCFSCKSESQDVMDFKTFYQNISGGPLGEGDNVVPDGGFTETEPLGLLSDPTLFFCDEKPDCDDGTNNGQTCTCFEFDLDFCPDEDTTLSFEQIKALVQACYPGDNLHELSAIVAPCNQPKGVDESGNEILTTSAQALVLQDGKQVRHLSGGMNSSTYEVDKGNDIDQPVSFVVSAGTKLILCGKTSTCS